MSEHTCSSWFFVMYTRIFTKPFDRHHILRSPSPAGSAGASLAPTGSAGGVPSPAGTAAGRSVTNGGACCSLSLKCGATQGPVPVGAAPALSQGTRAPGPHCAGPASTTHSLEGAAPVPESFLSGPSTPSTTSGIVDTVGGPAYAGGQSGLTSRAPSPQAAPRSVTIPSSTPINGPGVAAPVPCAGGAARPIIVRPMMSDTPPSCSP